MVQEWVSESNGRQREERWANRSPEGSVQESWNQLSWDENSSQGSQASKQAAWSCPFKNTRSQVRARKFEWPHWRIKEDCETWHRIDAKSDSLTFPTSPGVDWAATPARGLEQPSWYVFNHRSCLIPQHWSGWQPWEIEQWLTIITYLGPVSRRALASSCGGLEGWGEKLCWPTC